MIALCACGSGSSQQQQSYPTLTDEPDPGAKGDPKDEKAQKCAAIEREVAKLAADETWWKARFAQRKMDTAACPRATEVGNQLMVKYLAFLTSQIRDDDAEVLARMASFCPKDADRCARTLAAICYSWKPGRLIQHQQEAIARWVTAWSTPGSAIGDRSPVMWIAAQRCHARLVGNDVATRRALQQAKRWETAKTYEPMWRCAQSCELSASGKAAMLAAEANRGLTAHLRRRVGELHGASANQKTFDALQSTRKQIDLLRREVRNHADAIGAARVAMDSRLDEAERQLHASAGPIVVPVIRKRLAEARTLGKRARAAVKAKDRTTAKELVDAIDRTRIDLNQLLARWGKSLGPAMQGLAGGWMSVEKRLISVRARLATLL